MAGQANTQSQQQPQRSGPFLTGDLITWLQGQSFNNILLLTILTCIAYGSYWLATVAIPSHLSQIQKGYEELQDRYHVESQQQRDTYQRTSDRDYETIRSLLKGNHGVDLPPLAEKRMTKTVP